MSWLFRSGLVSCVVLTTTVLASTGCSDHVEQLASERKDKGQTSAPAASADVPPIAIGQAPPGVAPNGAAPRCAPTGVLAATSGWRPPNALHRSLCNANEIAAIVACYVARDASACNMQVSLECHTCVVSDKVTSPTYGPIIFDERSPNAVELNVGGCVAAASADVSATGCGAKVAMAESCTQRACAACPADAECAAAASTGVCTSLQQEARACAQQFLGMCKPTGTPVQQAMGLGQLFCM